MRKILPFNQERDATNYFYKVVFTDPADNKEYNYIIGTYISEISDVSIIIKHSTKYSFTIERSSHKNFDKDVISINQAVAYFKRLRFVKRQVVQKSKIVTWNEVEEIEL